MTYKLILSTKNVVVIDEEDYKKFKAYSSSGNFLQLKKAVINPSFVVAIIPSDQEKDRMVEGYIDEERGIFVMTSDKKEDPVLEDEFNGSKSLV